MKVSKKTPWSSNLVQVLIPLEQFDVYWNISEFWNSVESSLDQRRFYFAVESSQLIVIDIQEYNDFRFASWIKSEELIFPDILRLGE